MKTSPITIIVLLGALFAAPLAFAEGFDCSTLKCCWNDYIHGLKDCRMSFGQRPANESPEARKQREELTKACLGGARDMLDTCRKSVADKQKNLGAKKESKSLNGGHPMAVSGDLASLASVFEFEVSVSANEAGPWTLYVANGLPDIPGLEGVHGSARASGLVELDGHLVSGPEPLDERTFDLRFPLFLSQGTHVLRFTLTNADPVSSHAYVTAVLDRD